MELTESLVKLYRGYVRDIVTMHITRSDISINRPDLPEITHNFTKYTDRVTLCLSPPRCLGSLPEKFSSIPTRVSLPGSFVCEFRDIQLVGPDAIAITADDRYVIEETVAKPVMLTDAIMKAMYNKKAPLRKETTRISHRPTASLCGIQSSKYFHWFADYLPRVRGIEKFNLKTGTYPDVIIPPDPPKWMYKSLDFVGVPRERMIEWSGERLQLETLVMPSVPRLVDQFQVFYYPRELVWISSRIKNQLNIRTSNKNRVFITRRSASTRRIINEKECIELLEKFGFEAVDLTQLSFEKQVRIFANAQYVIGPHGAGLVNMIYAEDAKILEIFGDFVTTLYYCIADGLGFDYTCIQCESTKQRGSTQGISAPGTDILINVTRLKKAVEMMISE